MFLKKSHFSTVFLGSSIVSLTSLERFYPSAGEEELPFQEVEGQGSYSGWRGSYTPPESWWKLRRLHWAERTAGAQRRKVTCDSLTRILQTKTNRQCNRVSLKMYKHPNIHCKYQLYVVLWFYLVLGVTSEVGVSSVSEVCCDWMVWTCWTRRSQYRRSSDIFVFRQSGPGDTHKQTHTFSKLHTEINQIFYD